jgi:hypothetical protein
LLHAGNFQVLQDHFGEGFLDAVLGASLIKLVDQFVILVHPQDAMRAQALDGERPGDAHLLPVLIGPVIEILELRLGGDRGVDLRLAGDTRIPPVTMHLLDGVRPRLISVARDFPFLPFLP